MVTDPSAFHTETIRLIEARVDAVLALMADEPMLQLAACLSASVVLLESMAQAADHPLPSDVDDVVKYLKYLIVEIVRTRPMPSQTH